MVNKLIQFSFSGGIFSPSFHGRADLEKYSLGIADALNYFVDYRGGVTSRAGTEFLDYVLARKVAFSHFRYNTDVGNTYLLVWTQYRLRFVQNGAYVLESPKTITGVSGNILTITAHGWDVDDTIKIGAVSFNIEAKTTNTVTLSSALDGSPLSAVIGDTASRIYTVTTPYDADDLKKLTFRQQKNDIIITHTDYPPAKLTRSGHTSWSYAPIAFGLAGAAPDSFAAAGSGVGTAAVAYTITAIGQNGKESPLRRFGFLETITNYSTTAGYASFVWDPVPGAVRYNVYRSVIFPTSIELNAGQTLGFIGSTVGCRFTDTNILPDYTKTPQLHLNPFAPGAVEYLTITNSGSGYTDMNITLTDATGTGFICEPILTDGLLTGVLVLRRGEGYTAPTVNISGSGGSGAAATANLGPASGTYPATSLVYNQRQWFFGTKNDPMRLYASRSEGDLTNFNLGQLALATDPVILDLDSVEMTPVRHAELVEGGMFLFTADCIWQVVKDSEGFTPTKKTENGIGLAPPLRINRDIIFPLSEGTGVWALRPANLPTFYVDVDLSIYAGNLFTKEDQINSWCFAREPYRIVWAATVSGKLLSMTYIPEQNVYAWMPHDTKGRVLAVECLREDGIDVLYLAVQRGDRFALERMVPRQFPTVEDIFAVDCGLSLPRNYPAADLTLVGNSVRTTAAVFSPADVGAIIRVGGGRGTIVSYNSATEVSLYIDMALTAPRYQTDDYSIFPEGTWTLDQPVTSVSGLYHLENQLVDVFADGSVIGRRRVREGAVTLDQPASRVIVGLPFDGFVETLPLTSSDAIIEDRKKRITGVFARLEKTRGLVYGTGGHDYPMRERGREDLGTPTAYQEGLVALPTRDDWRADTSVTFRKEGPVASTVLNVIIEVDLGDDTN
jgi:hypothetical protein